MDREWKVDVNLTVNDIFFFLLRHTISTWQGKLTWGLGILSLIGAPIIVFTLEDNFTAVIFLIVAFMYLVATPVSLYSNAQRQMISNSVFKNKIVFTLTDEILHIKQYTGEAQLFWTQMERIDITHGLYLLYVNDKQAFILPKRFIDKTDAEGIAKFLRGKKQEIAQLALAKEKDSDEPDKGKKKKEKKEKRVKQRSDKELLSERIKSFKLVKENSTENREKNKKSEQKNKNANIRNKIK